VTRRSRARSGHSLLEAIIATAIFVLVSIALSGVWVMYGRSLAKSGEVLAANNLARSVSEGLVANGWDWLKTLEGATPLPEEDFVVERRIRGRQSDINYNVTYEAFFNSGKAMSNLFSDDICRLTISVRWHSNTGGKDVTPDYNNEATYVSYVYRKGI
jgi:type II secretory pathway pseudopilin PulG